MNNRNIIALAVWQLVLRRWLYQGSGAANDHRFFRRNRWRGAKVARAGRGHLAD